MLVRVTHKTRKALEAKARLRILLRPISCRKNRILLVGDQTVQAVWHFIAAEGVFPMKKGISAISVNKDDVYEFAIHGDDCFISD